MKRAKRPRGRPRRAKDVASINLVVRLTPAEHADALERLEDEPEVSLSDLVRRLLAVR